jgi:acyl carrier protein
MTPIEPGVDLGRSVKTVIGRHLEGRGAGGEVPPEGIPSDEPLSQLGLDSIGSISLLFDLEETFGIVFPDEALVPDTFSTAASVEAAVAGLLARAEQGTDGTEGRAGH